MESLGVANDKNIPNENHRDVHSAETQYLLPPMPRHIVISTPEETERAIGNDGGELPRIRSTGAIQDMQLSRVASNNSIVALSRRPSAAVTAMQRPSVPRGILLECVLIDWPLSVHRH